MLPHEAGIRTRVSPRTPARYRTAFLPVRAECITLMLRRQNAVLYQLRYLPMQWMGRDSNPQLPAVRREGVEPSRLSLRTSSSGL